MHKFKSDIVSALSCIKRKGIEKLVVWLNGSDFYTAPASTMFHGNYEGGLAEHSWNVYDLLVKKNEQFQTQYLSDTLAICGLLHDVCKIGMYVENLDGATDAQLFRLNKEAQKHKHKLPKFIDKNYASDLIGWYVNGAQGEMPVFKKSYKVDDQFPIGHGSKSVYLISKYIELTEEEVYAITWHMGAWDISQYDTYAYNSAIKKSRLITLLTTSDMESTNIIEG